MHPKIGLVTVDYAPPFGGMGRSVRTLADSLRAENIDVAVYDASKRPRRVRCARNVGFSLSLSHALRQWIEQESIDIVHLHTGPGGVFLSSRLPVPVVVTAHHTYSDQSRLPRQWWKTFFVPWERATYQRADAVVAVSEDTADSLTRSYSLQRDQITVISPGCDLTRWIAADRDAEARDHQQVVCIGRRGVRKGFDLLLQAWEEVHATYPAAHLSIVGAEGVSHEGVSFLGAIEDDTLQQLLGTSRMVVCPSRLEGFGLSAAEAIASGTPVVATNVPGLRTTVTDDVSGLLVSPDAPSITRGIRTLLTDDDLWHRLHDGARAERHRFDASLMARAHASLYSRVYSPSRCSPL